MIAHSRPWSGSKIMPLVVVDSSDQIKFVIDALLDAGVRVIEIGLRTPESLRALEIAVNYSDITVAAGTILTKEQLVTVMDAGVAFGVSPVLNPEVLELSSSLSFPLIPGIATVSEAQLASNFGYSSLKVYPADLLGEEKFIRAVSSVMPDLSMMPSGGVSEANMTTYLNEPNVFAVSGSWIAPRELIRSGNFKEMTAIASRAVSITTNF